MEIADPDWGCTHTKHSDEQSIHACIVNVEDLTFIAQMLTQSVLDTSWMLNMDAGTQRSYKYTANETAEALVQIFNEVANGNPLGAEFGEVMVSTGSSRALELIFEHNRLPIAEIWKPQKKQNEGFDFHTECNDNLINFGEAKYSASTNPHGEAIPQIGRFLNEEKHFRDRVHLINLTKQESIENLDQDKYGVIAAFSITSQELDKIMANALASIAKSDLIGKANKIYVVGVKCSK